MDKKGFIIVILRYQNNKCKTASFHAEELSEVDTNRIFRFLDKTINEIGRKPCELGLLVERL
jgi:hypothetical protein